MVSDSGFNIPTHGWQSTLELIFPLTQLILPSLLLCTPISLPQMQHAQQHSLEWHLRVFGPVHLDPIALPFHVNFPMNQVSRT